MLILMTAIDTPEDKSKFEKIYNKYIDVMYYAAFGILGGQYEAEDAVSQTLFKLISHLEKIEDVDSKKTKAFIITVTEHTAIDCYRKMKRERFTQINDEEICSQYAQEFNEGNEVEDCINSLPVNYVVVLRMRYSQGFSDEEIADILGITKENVRSRIMRGKRKLQKILEERGLWY